jgi:hypothetical protein
VTRTIRSAISQLYGISPREAALIASMYERALRVAIAALYAGARPGERRSLRLGPVTVDISWSPRRGKLAAGLEAHARRIRAPAVALPPPAPDPWIAD